MARARTIEGLVADDPYAAAAAKVVSVRAREVADHAQGVLDVADVERVHDMRVATRRLRAALEFFAPCFPPDRFEDALREVKAIANALGRRRDADVAIEALRGFAAALPTTDRPGVASLIERTRTEQEQANAELEAFVEVPWLAALGERLSELVMEAEGLVAEGSA
jgi:CHAD domain-containing protein